MQHTSYSYSQLVRAKAIVVMKRGYNPRMLLSTKGKQAAVIYFGNYYCQC